MIKTNESSEMNARVLTNRYRNPRFSEGQQAPANRLSCSDETLPGVHGSKVLVGNWFFDREPVVTYVFFGICAHFALVRLKKGTP